MRFLKTVVLLPVLQSRGDLVNPAEELGST
jgi:hypothetical protein